MPKVLPVDPRPSKAHPEHREHRKKLEKEHPAFGWKQGLILGLMGVTIFMNIEKEVEKREQRNKEKEEKEKKRRQRDIQAGTWEPDMDSRDGSRDGRDRHRDHPRELEDGRARRRSWDPNSYRYDGRDWDRDDYYDRDRRYSSHYASR